MTQFEKDEALRVLSEKMLALQATMCKSDNHASKCEKLGISFKEAYPDDYSTYVKAREDYNIAEEEYKKIEAEPVDDKPHDIAD